MESDNRPLLLSEQKRLNQTEKQKRVTESVKKHYLKNRDRILEKARLYRQTDRYKETLKNFKEKNKDYLNTYYKENQYEKHYHKKLERLTCDVCGGVYPRAHKSDHMKSKKHLKVAEQT